MQHHPPTKPNRSGALDLLRFLAVIAVFYGHFADTFNYIYRIVPENLRYNPIIRYVTPAMMVFFMVSSFVVTMTTMKRTVKDFVVIRLSRLYPLFWVSCIVGFFISRYFYLHSYLPQVSFSTFLVNLTMMPALFGKQLLSPVYHTLLVELFFYLFIVLIMAFKLWDKILTVITIILISCFIYQFINPEVYIITHFTGGMLFYFLFSKKYTQWKVYALLALNAVISIWGAKVTAEGLNAYYHDHGSNPYILGLIIFLLQLLFLGISTRKINIPGYLIFQKLGEIAYPFYLFHLYFLGIYWYFRNSIQPDLLLLLLLITIGLFSWFLNVFVEKPLSKIASMVIIYITNLFSKRTFTKRSESTTHQF